MNKINAVHRKKNHQFAGDSVFAITGRIPSHRQYLPMKTNTKHGSMRVSFRSTVAAAGLVRSLLFPYSHIHVPYMHWG